jgi:NAD-dependent deacetylase
MIAPDLETSISRLRDLIEGARTIVPFTGAGISTECGIPDFRSPGGLWTKNQPIPFDDFMTSAEMRDESWRRRFVMEESFAKARPGRGHRALASLYRAGKVPALVTQNIDNLHQISGIAADDVVELHGNTT